MRHYKIEVLLSKEKLEEEHSNEGIIRKNASVITWHNRLLMRFFPVGLLEGRSLKQEELAEMFGTSRIPIREAFQVLEGQGLIVRLATRRIYAVELSEEQIQIIYEMIGDIFKESGKEFGE